MSRETSEWLNRNVLIGMTGKRGNAWHYRAADQGSESNHYAGAIPVEDVKRRLFGWQAIELPITVQVPQDVPADFETMTHISDDGMPVRQEIVGKVIPNRKAIVTSDTHDVLGIFADGYQPHQYDAWLLDTVSTILDDELSISSAGLLRNRGVAWVEVSIPDTVKAAGGVEFRPNLLATTSFDGSIATTYKRTITDVVCDNTRSMALAEKSDTYRVKHTKYSGHKIDAARDALGIVYAAADEFSAEVSRLLNWKISDVQFRKVIEQMVPLSNDMGKAAQTRAQNKRGELWQLGRFDDRCAPWIGTAYGVVQTFNTYEHHVKGTKGQSKAERNMLGAITGAFEQSDAEVMKVLVGV